MNNLKKIRNSTGMTQEELARIVNCTLRTIQNIENKNYSPSVFLALKIKNALNVNIESIFILKD